MTKELKFEVSIKYNGEISKGDIEHYGAEIQGYASMLEDLDVKEVTVKEVPNG